MEDFCMSCGCGQLVNGNCGRCGATMEDDGSYSYDPNEVQRNIDRSDDSMRRRGYEWDEQDRDYRR